MTSKSLGKRPAVDDHPVRIKQEFRESPVHSTNGTLPPEQPPIGDLNDHVFPPITASWPEHVSQNHYSMPAQTRITTRQANEQKAMTTEAFLDSSDKQDIILLQHCAPASPRYHDFISAFVDRALFRGLDPNNGCPSAMEYFDLIGAELRKSNFDLESVYAAQQALVSQWQERLAAMVGGTVNTPERLERIVEVVSKSAEELGGVVRMEYMGYSRAHGVDGTNLLDDLENTISARPYDTELPHPNALEPESIAVTAQDQVLRQEEISFREDHHQQVEGVLNHDDSLRQDVIVSKRNFEEPYDFFVYHANKARTKHLGADAGPCDESQTYNDWHSLPHEAQQIWCDLFGRWQAGEKGLLRAKVVAHLFKAGHACVPHQQLPSDEGYGSGSLPPSSAGPQAATGQDLTPSAANKGQEDHSSASNPAQPPVQGPRYPPYRERFIPFDHPECTVFIRVPKAVTQDMSKVVDACRAAAGGPNRSTACLSTRKLGSQIFAITFKEELTARRLAATTVHISNAKTKAAIHCQPTLYPKIEPTTFATQLSNEGDTAIAPPTVFAALADMFPGTTMCLARQTSTTSKLIAWVAYFAKPIGCLRFSIPMVQADGAFRSAWFDPVSGSTRCPVCSIGHDVRKCDFLKLVPRKELQVGGRKLQYSARIPVTPAA